MPKRLDNSEFDRRYRELFRNLPEEQKRDQEWILETMARNMKRFVDLGLTISPVTGEEMPVRQRISKLIFPAQ